MQLFLGHRSGARIQCYQMNTAQTLGRALSWQPAGPDPRGPEKTDTRAAGKRCLSRDPAQQHGTAIPVRGMFQKGQLTLIPKCSVTPRPCSPSTPNERLSSRKILALYLYFNWTWVLRRQSFTSLIRSSKENTLGRTSCPNMTKEKQHAAAPHRQILLCELPTCCNEAVTPNPPSRPGAEQWERRVTRQALPSCAAQEQLQLTL